jgi:deoxycytidylate deaminase
MEIEKPLFKQSEFTDILPFDLWKQVYKQAERSTLDSFRTGAIIFDTKTMEVIGRGCSHHSEWTTTVLFSTHAEDHALKESKHKRLHNKSYSVLVLTIGRAGNPTYSSRPCISCASRLEEEDIDLVYYPERLTDGNWTINCEKSIDLVDRASDSDFNARYAKDLRIPRVTPIERF